MSLTTMDTITLLNFVVNLIGQICYLIVFICVFLAIGEHLFMFINYLYFSFVKC